MVAILWLCGGGSSSGRGHVMVALLHSIAVVAALWSCSDGSGSGGGCIA